MSSEEHKKIKIRIYLNYLNQYDILESEKNKLYNMYTNTNPLSTANTEGIFCGAWLPHGFTSSFGQTTCEV